MSGHALTWWAELVMARFAAAGVKHVVISPGSRSTALVLAADRNPQLTCHTCIDERAAAFFALGLGRATGRPALLLCTSGTAAAHYFPAVIEATLNRVPLLVLSADRPLELVGCAAPQTIDQVKLFGDHVRSYVDLGLPDPAPRALRGTARAVDQAVLASRWPVAGAVHLNARARKPFEPDPAASPADEALEKAVRALIVAPRRVAPPLAVPDPEALAEVAALVRFAERGVILAGPAPLSAARWRDPLVRLARATGYPVLAEATSQLRAGDRPADVCWVDHFDLLLGAPSIRGALAPDLVLQVGAPPVAGAVEHWLDQAQPPRVVLADAGWNDWLGTASHLVFGEVDALLDSLAARIPSPVADDGWCEAWARAEARALSVVEQVVGAEPGATEAHAVQSMLKALPDGVLLMLGNSLALRLVDWYAGPMPAVDVLCQRGANGIDGLIAGAAGSVAGTGRPCVLLLGDVSAVHDLNALLLARDLPAPLVVVVVNNAGGRIFDLLPVARHAGVPAESLRHLVTPHDVNLSAASAAYGVAYRRGTPADLGALLREALGQPQCTVIEVPVAPDRAASMLREIRANLGSG